MDKHGSNYIGITYSITLVGGEKTCSWAANMDSAHLSPVNLVACRYPKSNVYYVPIL